MSDKQAYQHEMRQKLTLWQTQIQDMKQELKETSGQAREALEQRIEELRSSIQQAQSKLQRLEQASGSEYDKQKSAIDKGLEEIKRKFGGMG